MLRASRESSRVVLEAQVHQGGSPISPFRRLKMGMAEPMRQSSRCTKKFLFRLRTNKASQLAQQDPVCLDTFLTHAPEEGERVCPAFLDVRARAQACLNRACVRQNVGRQRCFAHLLQPVHRTMAIRRLGTGTDDVGVRYDIGLHTAFQHLPKECYCQVHLPQLRRRSDRPIEGPGVGLQLRFMHAPEPSLGFFGTSCTQENAASSGECWSFTI